MNRGILCACRVKSRLFCKRWDFALLSLLVYCNKGQNGFGHFDRAGMYRVAFGKDGDVNTHRGAPDGKYFGKEAEHITDKYGLLEDEAVEKFNKPFDKLLSILAQRIAG